MASETTALGTPATETGQPELKRAIGPKLLLFFVIGDILGTGIYALVGSVAGQIGGALWLPFLIAFIVAGFTAFSYLELVGKYPKAAGAALYTNRAFRLPILTFLVAFLVMCSGITSASTAAKAFAETYLNYFLSWPVLPVAIGFIVVLALVNFRGVGESVKANMVLTIIELSGLAIIIVIGIFAAAEGKGDPSRLLEIDTGRNSTLFAITAATSLAFFAMVGFEDSVNMAEECKEPVRIFPRALLTGLAAAGFIYVPVAVTSSLLVETKVLSGREVGRPAEGRRDRRARVPTVGILRDRPVRRDQLGADQHADGQPAALRNGQRADHSPAVRHRARAPPLALGGHPVHQPDRRGAGVDGR